MKKIHTFLLAVIGAVLMSTGAAEATFGFGYRANDTVRMDDCYRSPAWDYAVPFYTVGPNRTRHTLKHRYDRKKGRDYAEQSSCGLPNKRAIAPSK